MKKMSRVALIGENSTEYINTLINIWNSGDCAVLIDWRIPFQAAVEMMNEAEVHKCYVDKKQFDKGFNKDYEGITFLPFERKTNLAELLPRSTYDNFKPNYGEDEAIILYSSGTTGKAKGIILSHFAINTNADAIIDYINPISKDCIYIAKTLAHSSTLIGELLVALKTHIRLVIAPTIVPPRYILNNIKKFNVSLICLNPTLLSMFTDEVQRRDYDISSLRTIYVSGSVLNDKIYINAHRIFKNIPIYNVYGLSEAGPRVTAQGKNCCKSNSVGKPIKNVEIVIVNEQGVQVLNGEHGIIHVKTPSRFSGYVSGQLKHPSMYKDWLNTGDIGYIDKNDELHIMDRIDDVIIINSYKIYPSEVKKIVLKHPNVVDCIVFASDTNSIICKYTVSSDININDELSRLCKINLPFYEIPSKFICVEKIPRNINGKISYKNMIN